MYLDFSPNAGAFTAPLPSMVTDHSRQPFPGLNLSQTFVWANSGSVLASLASNSGAKGPKPLWMYELAHSADRMRALAPGWDGPGSIGISENVIFRAVQIIEDALKGAHDPAAPHLAPGADGSLQIEWHRVHAQLEFCLEPDGSFDIWGRDRRTGAEFEGTDADALALFYRWAAWTAQRPADAANVPQEAAPALFELAA